MHQPATSGPHTVPQPMPAPRTVAPLGRHPDRAAHPADDRPRVLLVDDEPLNVRTLASALGDRYALSFATRGEEALHFVATGPEVSLILLDVMMPGLDGFEVCNRLKANPRTAGIPVVFLTGLDDPANEERGLCTGAVDYIQKPFSAGIVRARVRLQIELQARTRELKRVQALLHEQATRDELTDLPNRRAFKEHLAQTLAESRRHGRRFGVMAIDLDHFKPINDTYGHAAGDEVLRTVARRLRVSLRDEDTVSRVGGDEFIALLTDVEQIDRTRVAAERILESVRAAIAIDGATVQVGASIGIAIFPDAADSIDALLESADAACYEAKRAGRNGYVVHPATHAERTALLTPHDAGGLQREFLTARA